MTERLSNLGNNSELVNPPSIGSKDISFDRAGNRARQIVEKVIGNNYELEPILKNAEQFGDFNNATRIVVRVLMSSGTHIASEKDHFRQEAKIPLAGEFRELSLLYYGWNSGERHSPIYVLRQENQVVQDTLKRTIKQPEAIFARAEGYNLERLVGELNSLDYERLREMYRLSFTEYPFDIETSIRFMVKNEGYVVYAARSKTDGQLYAVCVTEEMVLNLADGRRFVMREMGDSAKMPEVNGLNAPLKLMLIKRAFEDGVDLVFCESRAALPAVNAVNRDIGMEYSGFLMQHTRIGGEGIDEKSLYGNMNVWALNKDGIDRIGQEVKSLIS